MRVPVLNNCQGPYYVQLPHPRGQDNKVKGVGETIVLQPGLNLIDSETWTIAKKNPSVTALLKDKVPVSKSLEADPSKFGHPKLKTLDRTIHATNAFADKDGKPLDLAEALGMIAMTQDTDYLMSWKQGYPPGSDISKAIDARLIEITSGIDSSVAA